MRSSLEHVKGIMEHVKDTTAKSILFVYYETSWIYHLVSKCLHLLSDYFHF